MELKIGQTTSIWDDLPAIQAPPLTDIACLHGARPAENEVVVMVRQEALLQIDAHGRSDTSVELGGLLLGNVFQNEQRLYVDVAAAIVAKSDKNGPVHFTFTADAWADAHAEREADYPDLKIVGWFHTHPDLGVFYSGDDVVVHTTAFALPWHVGLVLDPVRNTVALFGWEQDPISEEQSIEPLQGWFEMASQQDHTIVPWRYRTADGLRGMWTDATRSRYERHSSGGQSLDAEPELPISDGILTFLAMSLALIGLLFTFLVYYPNQERNEASTAILESTSQAQIDAWHAAGTLSCPSENLFIIDPAPGQQLTADGAIQIYGKSDQTGIYTYLLQVESAETGWTTLNEIQQSRTADDGISSLGRWVTRGLPAGEYDLRLVGVSSGGEMLTSGACVTSVQLVTPE